MGPVRCRWAFAHGSNGNALVIKRKSRRMAMRMLKRTWRNSVLRESNPGHHCGIMIGIMQTMFACGQITTYQLARLERICLAEQKV